MGGGGGGLGAFPRPVTVAETEMKEQSSLEVIVMHSLKGQS